MEPHEQKELLDLFGNTSGDFRNLLLGNYGRLPLGWPADWIYQSAFGEDWESKVRERKEMSPLDTMEDEDIEGQAKNLAHILGRDCTTEELVLYLMHPKDAVAFIEFREKYGEAPLVLPTDVWLKGLRKPGDKVEFDLWGKPYCIELVSIGAEHDGIIDVVMAVNNRTRVYPLKTPRAKAVEVRMARGDSEVGSPINGTVWRIGNTDRGTLKVGDIIHKGEEIANIEAMKMENPVLAPFDGQIVEIPVFLNNRVEENQLLLVLEPVRSTDGGALQD
jgi:pyruvate carboxylase